MRKNRWPSISMDSTPPYTARSDLGVLTAPARQWRPGFHDIEKAARGQRRRSACTWRSWSSQVTSAAKRRSSVPDPNRPTALLPAGKSVGTISRRHAGRDRFGKECQSQVARRQIRSRCVESVQTSQMPARYGFPDLYSSSNPRSISLSESVVDNSTARSCHLTAFWKSCCSAKRQPGLSERHGFSIR